MYTLKDFKKKKDFIVCVDSDGCAMDTMDVKHKQCFGPRMTECYGLSEKSAEVQAVWDEINLYKRTRGINRFLALVAVLRAVEERGIAKLEKPYGALEKWTERASELSNPALEAEIALGKEGSEQLALALEWSKQVNRSIKALGEDHGAYPNVKEALEGISKSADVSVVSSANSGALEDEWKRCGLDGCIDALLGQESGTKAHCINVLMSCGYANDRVLMVGDAPGDLKAAEKNHVLFYPILVGREAFSWERMSNEAFSRFIEGTYSGSYQQKLIDEFYRNLE